MSKKNRATDRAARAAETIREQQREEARRRNLMVGGVVLVLLVAIIGGFLLTRAQDTTSAVDAAAGSAGSRYGVTIGSAKAPHTVVIYEDFLCPFCGELESTTRDDFARLAGDGKVRVEYRPFELLSTLGDYSARSAGAFSIVLDRSGPEVAKKFHDLLYENQPEEKGPFPDDAALVKLAVQAGAQEAAVKGPIEADAGATWVTGATQAALDAGVRSTPTVLLDGKVFQDGRTVQELGQNLVDQVS
jgi:protein-disulfide isomerase